MIAATMRFSIFLACASTLFAQATYDLVLKGGHLIDCKNNISCMRDIAIRDGKVAAVAMNIPATQAHKVVNVAGLYVTPGLIDLHAHVFSGSNGGMLAGATRASFPITSPSESA
jgi:dihydroorotase